MQENALKPSEMCHEFSALWQDFVLTQRDSLVFGIQTCSANQ